MKISNKLIYLWLYGRLGSLLRLRFLLFLIIPTLFILVLINILLLLALNAAMDSFLLALLAVIGINIGLIFLLIAYVKKKINALKSRFQRTPPPKRPGED